MPFAAALSTAAETAAAARQVCDATRAGLDGRPDLAVLFFSPHHVVAAAGLAAAVREGLDPRCLIGCVGESVIGNDREVEGGPAVSLWAGRWRGPVDAEPFRLTLERTPDGPTLLGRPDALEKADPASSALLLLGDPLTFPAEAFLAAVNNDRPGLPVLGGMASGVGAEGECRLVLGGDAHDRGAVGVLLQGRPLGLRSIVSQGCRPIGHPMVITKADDNVILGLGGKTPLEQLQGLWPTLGVRERLLFQQGLHVGRVINEYRGDFQRGDFLVRNVLGVDRATGALAVTERVRIGQTVQFHVRDAETADEDLRALLQLDLHAHEKPPAAALVFSCNGRGSRLFPGPDHDARAVRAEAGPIPLAGFFAQGELGPVGGQNFIHGFTASVALFED